MTTATGRGTKDPSTATATARRAPPKATASAAASKATRAKKTAKKTTKAAASRESGRRTVVAGVQADLKQIGPVPVGAALAASALELAKQLDDKENSATSKSMLARALIDTLEQLRALAPPKEEGDRLDDLNARRAARLAGRPAS